MRVAIIHYWLIGMRGGEKVLQALCEMYPDADIFTHVVDVRKLSDDLTRHKIETTFIQKLPFARTHYQKYLPFMPRALEELDLSAYDLVLSSESGPAKGVIPRPDAFHVCYCHSPMRYIWDHYHEYRRTAGFLARQALPHIAHRLRLWDVASAARVDQFVANSQHVARRIEKYYRRESIVIHPPVDISDFAAVRRDDPDDYYLAAGELVGYKRFDLAVDAFTHSGRKLVVIGDGEERAKLEARAGDNVSFLGRVSFDELKARFAACRALIFPGEEDFGIIPVEVMASGRPVIAFRRGGALDSVSENETGLFFDEQSSDALNDAVAQFERHLEPFVDSVRISNYTQRFSVETFKSSMSRLISAHLPKAADSSSEDTPPQLTAKLV